MRTARAPPPSQGQFILVTRDAAGTKILSEATCPLERTAGKFLHGYELEIKGHWDSSIASRPLGNGFRIDECTATATEGDEALAVTDNFTQKIVTSDASTMLPAVSALLVAILVAAVL